MVVMPESTREETASIVPRCAPFYSNDSSRFELSPSADLDDDCFQRQYCNVYQARIAQLKPRVVEAIKANLGETPRPHFHSSASRSVSAEKIERHFTKVLFDG